MLIFGDGQMSKINPPSSPEINRELFDEGWRIVDNDNRMMLTCPKCVNTPTAEGAISNG